MLPRRSFEPANPHLRGERSATGLRSLINKRVTIHYQLRSSLRV